MKKMTLWLGSIALASAAAVVNAQADTGAAAAATPQDLAALGQDVAAAPAALPAPLVADAGTPSAGTAQYYSRAQIGDAPVQTTGASYSGADSYGASLYGSSASGRRTTAPLASQATDKP